MTARTTGHRGTEARRLLFVLVMATSLAYGQGHITEFPLPSAEGSPINIAVGPDRNIWYTKGAKLGRVTPDGTITELTLPSSN